MPFAPMRLRSWLRGPKIGSKVGKAWFKRAPLPCRPFVFWPGGDDDLESADPTPRLSSDVQKWSRDLARCVGVIHFDHNIDRGAADLQRAKMIDRPSGHLTPKDVSGYHVEKAAETWLYVRVVCPLEGGRLLRAMRMPRPLGPRDYY